MSKASGFVLLVAGLAAAAYVLPSGERHGRAGAAAALHRCCQDPAAKRRERGRRRDARAPARGAAGAAAVAAAPSARHAILLGAGRRHARAAPERAAGAAPQKAGAVPQDRDAIGRELQKELKRVGCYEGELNGAWTPSTRQAMKAFTDRVNATLPTDEPDSILLTLVQAYQDKVCGKPCPAGQGLSDVGRCVPNAILARAAKKGAPRRGSRRAARREADARHHRLVDDDHRRRPRRPRRRCTCRHAAADRRPHGARRAGDARGDAAARHAAAAPPRHAARGNAKRPPKVDAKGEGWARNRVQDTSRA